jgi:pyruvate,orthophosphate dikinase
VLLVRIETSPEDISGMIAAEGILTARGGVTSHAALVARQMGKVCVAARPPCRSTTKAKTMTAAGITFKEGDFLSIDGTTARCMPARSRPPARRSSPACSKASRQGRAQKTEKFRTTSRSHEMVLDKPPRLQVRTNADTAGADPPRRGLRCRGHRPDPHRAHVLRGHHNASMAVREMILADTWPPARPP